MRPGGADFKSIHRADETKLDQFDNFEAGVINRIQTYRVPTIELLRDTPREAVCQVFEKVNTGGITLTVFELVTAIFASDGFNLRTDWEARSQRLGEHDVLKEVDATAYLTAITLLATYRRHQHNPENPVQCTRKDVLKLRIEAGDLNADGKSDVVVSNVTSNTLGVLLNNGIGGLGAAQTFATGSYPNGFTLADVNSDGLLDLSTANCSSGTVSVWLNATVRLQLQLQDANGLVLATGIPAANLNAIISNFVATAGGTYYARVFGAGNATYNLLVTRGVAFDTESNNSFGIAEAPAGSQRVLGAITAAGTPPCFRRRLVHGRRQQHEQHAPTRDEHAGRWPR
jgi:FG-GAP-like repeat